MYDVAIIGTGPAGISAALTLSVHNKDYIWFGTKALSEKIRKAEQIRNYPGLPDITGSQFAAALRQQIQSMGLTITEEIINAVYPFGGTFSLAVNEKLYEARSLILTTGVESTKSIKGEAEFLGRGVSYCATCDGFLYRNKPIAVLCTTKVLEHEIAYLSSLASHVYLIPLYKDVAAQPENVEIIQRMPQKISGSKRVEKLIFADQEVAIDGMFLLKSAISPAVLVDGLQLDGPHIVVNRHMATNLPGCFAAGDCTGRPYQYAKAVGEGNVAAHSVLQYLAGKL